MHLSIFTLQFPTHGKSQIKRAVFLLFLIMLLTLALPSLKVNGESATVNFSVSSQYISASYSPTISVSDGTISPNSSTAISFSLSSESLTITVSIPGVGSTSMQTYPLAEREYDIPGLSYNVGFGSVGLKLTMKGVVSGQTGANDPGSLNQGSLSWISAGTKEVTLSTEARAEIGDSIIVSLHNLEYNLYIGVVASGNILGQEYSETLIPYQNAGSFSGSPSAVMGQFIVQQNFSILSALAFLWVFALATVLGGISIAYYLRCRGASTNRLVRSSIAVVSGVIIVVSLFFPWITSGGEGVRGLDLGPFTVSHGVVDVPFVGVVIMLILSMGMLTVLGGYLSLFGYLVGTKLVSNAAGIALFLSVVLAIGLGFIPTSIAVVNIDISPWICIFGSVLGIVAAQLERESD